MGANASLHTIVVCVESGLVQDVVSDRPLNYIVADEDTEGQSEDEVSEMPPMLAEALDSGAHEPIHSPMLMGAAIVSPAAVSEVVALHEKVSEA